MGSENEMVAVPVEPTEAMYEAGYDATRLPDGMPQFADAGFCLAHAGVIYRAMVGAARLAPAQPDAQQGESEFRAEIARIADDYHPCQPGDAPLALDEMREALVEALATPSSPALDAATIERCARDANEFAEVARQDGFDGADALDLIEEIGRTLAKALTIERDQDDLDTPEARLAMVRVAVWHITQGGNAGALAKAALDFIDLTAAQRAEMRGDAA